MTAAQLPAEQRVRETLRLLAKRDRARRRGAGMALLMSFAAAAVAGIGALSVRGAEDRRGLATYAGFVAGIGLVNMLPTLLTPGFTERFANGEPPPERRFGW